MSIELIKTPELDFGNYPLSANWFPAWLPCIFSFQRQDFAIVKIGDNLTGSITVQLSGDITSELNVGDNIYIRCVLKNVDITAAIVSFAYDGVSKTNIAILYPTSIGALATAVGYVNLMTTRLYNRLDISVLYYDTTTEITPGTYSQFTPDAQGNIQADIQEWLQLMVQANDEGNRYGLIQSSPQLGNAFVIQWREYYYSTVTGDEQGTFNAISYDNKFNVTNAVQQIGYEYGNNMAEYIAFVQGNSLAKFLTMFQEPTYFVGFPFDLSFLYDDTIDSNSQTLFRKDRQRDINDDNLTLLANAILDYTNYTCRLGFNFSYDPTAASTLVFLDAYTGSTEEGTITELKRVWINNDCQQSPIYLKWLNPVGGYDYWCFNWQNTTSVTTNNEVGFKKYVPAVNAFNSRYEVLSKDIQPQIELGADGLRDMDMLGISFLLGSPKVYMFTGNYYDGGTPIFVGVTVVSDTFQIDDSQENKNSIDFVILLPQSYNQQQ